MASRAERRNELARAKGFRNYYHQRKTQELARGKKRDYRAERQRTLVNKASKAKAFKQVGHAASPKEAELFAKGFAIKPGKHITPSQGRARREFLDWMRAHGMRIDWNAYREDYNSAIF